MESYTGIKQPAGEQEITPIESEGDYNQALTRIIESVGIDQFKEAKEGTISDILEKTIRLNWNLDDLWCSVSGRPSGPFPAWHHQVYAKSAW